VTQKIIPLIREFAVNLQMLDEMRWISNYWTNKSDGRKVKKLFYLGFIIGLAFGALTGSVQAADASHVEKLKKNKQCTRCNLSSASLEGESLPRANLSGADMKNTKLGNINLRGANLSRTNFSSASMPNANLRGANLSNAIMKRASLRSANLRGANLTGADLRGADLTGANLRSAKTEGMKVDGTTKLTGVQGYTAP